MNSFIKQVNYSVIVLWVQLCWNSCVILLFCVMGGVFSWKMVLVVNWFLSWLSVLVICLFGSWCVIMFIVDFGNIMIIKGSIMSGSMLLKISVECQL